MDHPTVIRPVEVSFRFPVTSTGFHEFAKAWVMNYPTYTYQDSQTVKQGSEMIITLIRKEPTHAVPGL
jgi:hypothetical protein